jgi:hypothetical protein
LRARGLERAGTGVLHVVRNSDVGEDYRRWQESEEDGRAFMGIEWNLVISICNDDKKPSATTAKWNLVCKLELREASLPAVTKG